MGNLLKEMGATGVVVGVVSGKMRDEDTQVVKISGVYSL